MTKKNQKRSRSLFGGVFFGAARRHSTFYILMTFAPTTLITIGQFLEQQSRVSERCSYTSTGVQMFIGVIL
jgi:hypothetical protein